MNLTRGAIDRLGERLRQSALLTEDDLAALQALRRQYFEVLSRAEHDVRAIAGSYPVSSRLKTVQTIVEKLRREEKMRLSRMQDIAGIRVVAPMTVRAQDDLAERVRGAFPNGRIVDRRERPSHGYRALHIYVAVDGVPVEIQIRTALQDRWAQIVERLADRWGRDLRYGGQPTGRSSDTDGAARREMWNLVARMSPLIAGCEALPSGEPSEAPVDPSFFCGQVDRLLSQLASKATVSGGL